MAKIIYAVAGEGFGHSSRFGISSERLDVETIERFLDKIDEPVPDDGGIIWPDNDKFFGILQDELKKLGKPINITAG